LIGITFARKILGLTGAELGKQLGVTRQAICLYESAENCIPEKHYDRLKEIFNLPPELLIKELTDTDKKYILSCYSKR
jgi:transcriptional regulator with XRE-family HTH domain